MLTVLLAFFISHSASAEDVCFKTVAEYEVLKPHLPEILREMPVYFAAENVKVMLKTVSGVGGLQFVDGTVRFYFNASRGINAPIKEFVKVCSNGTDIIFHFANGTNETVKVDGGNKILARKLLPMQKVDKENYTRISDGLDAKTEVGTEKVKAGEGNNVQ